eukprot:TRINITY_DN65071_c0_g1_i1.p1 TRINITY_DN65071_c0_g1~~TRINITY_DN65071_c0_g1_i1.p1  ORF type:complete len:345 (-),score=72.94 TRINITY_DN65071_c0_g1_i1:498-1532(-)
MTAGPRRRWGPPPKADDCETARFHDSVVEAVSAEKPHESARAWLDAGLQEMTPAGSSGADAHKVETEAAVVWHIYCDLDGVLADFERGVEEALGRRPADFRAAAEDVLMWKSLSKVRNFFGDLPWTEDGPQLWQYLDSSSKAGQATVSVLSGLPRGEWAPKQKWRWCREQLGLDRYDVDLCWAPEKPKWAAPGCILLDDNEDYRSPWEAAGGRFVHHRTGHLEASLAQLQLLLQQPPADSPNAAGRRLWRKPDDASSWDVSWWSDGWAASAWQDSAWSAGAWEAESWAASHETPAWREVKMSNGEKEARQKPRVPRQLENSWQPSLPAVPPVRAEEKPAECKQT